MDGLLDGEHCRLVSTEIYPERYRVWASDGRVLNYVKMNRIEVTSQDTTSSRRTCDRQSNL